MSVVLAQVAPYSQIMKRSSGGGRAPGGDWWPLEGVACATAVLHKLTQEVSRPILVNQPQASTTSSIRIISISLSMIVTYNKE